MPLLAPRLDQTQALIVVTMLGEPVAWARTRPQAKTGVLFTPTKQRNAAATFRLLAQQEMRGRAPLEGPISVDLLAVFAIPKGWSKKRRAAIWNWAPKRPDADNLYKLCADAGNGILWRDDAQIVLCQVTKIYGAEPRIELRVAGLSAA